MTEITEDICFIDIGTDNNTDVFQWRLPGKKTFPIDIVLARQSAIENFFQHNGTNDRKTVYYKQNNFVFTISANISVQYQFLEAILENVAKEFLENFGDLPIEMITQRITKGFEEIIPNLIEQAKKEGIKTVRAFCKICQKQKKIAVKKSLIHKAPSYPVPIVYMHEGHGVLIYVDANFEIRGVEMVSLSG